MYVCRYIYIYINMYTYTNVYIYIWNHPSKCRELLQLLHHHGNLHKKKGWESQKWIRAKKRINGLPLTGPMTSSNDDACVHRLGFTIFYSPKNSGTLFIGLSFSTFPSPTDMEIANHRHEMGQGSEGRSAGRCARPRLDSGPTWRSFHFDVTWKWGSLIRIVNLK